MSDRTALEQRAEDLAEHLRQKGYAISLVNNAVPSNVAAELLGVSERTLRRWRCEGVGPTSYLVVGRLWYRIAELIRFLGQKELDKGGDERPNTDKRGRESVVA